MKKKIIIGFGIVALVVIGAVFYLNYRNYKLSPKGSTEASVDALSVKVTYCRPSARGRVIFGTSAAGALQPYGNYWRLGANESTEITLSSDVQFNGQELKAGTYRMYALPGENEFEIRLNSELGEWGAFEPDYTKDILKTTVPVSNSEQVVELFTIDAKAGNDSIPSINLEFAWATTKGVITIVPKK